MKTLIVVAVLTAGLWIGPQEDMLEPPTHAAFDLAELVAQGEQSKRPWTGFLDRPTLSCGVYRLQTGATDGQGAHELDEVYHVVEGRARFVAGDEEFDAEAGSIFFVRRGIDHRFFDITEDLVVLVFFSKEIPEPR